MTEQEELAHFRYLPSQVLRAIINQLYLSQCCKDCFTAMTWLPLPLLCKRGTVLGTENGVHRLTIDQAARRRLLPRGKTKTCSQGHTCYINVYSNALERVTA